MTEPAGFYRAIIIPIFLIFLFASCAEKADQPTAVPGTPSTVDVKSTNSPSYNIWLTEQAHARGLSIAMKNDNFQVPQLVDFFD